MNAATKASVLGQFSFEGDSIPDFSEFDSTSVIEEYQGDSSRRPSEGKMAPTTTIETVTITRPLKSVSLGYIAIGAAMAFRTPLNYSKYSFTYFVPRKKVIAFICGMIVIILMIMALASSDWLMAAGWRQGLFAHCIEEDAPTPLPFNVVDPSGCYKARDVAYIHAAAALCVITLLTDLGATVLTGLGLRSNDHRRKYKYYRIAVYVMILSLISVLIALVVYPVCFVAELNEGNRTVWEFGWAYGVGWGAAIFLFGAVILLLCDKESEEIYYKERKIVHENESARA